MPGPQNADLIESVNAYGTPGTSTPANVAATADASTASAASSGGDVSDAYEIVASSSDLQQVTPTETELVQRISAQALPSGIVFAVNIGASIFTPDNTKSLLQIWAYRFNWIAMQPNVVTVFTGQTVNAADQLVDSMTIVVRSNSGRSTTDIVGDYTLADQGRAQNAINAAVANLNAVEAA